MLKKAVWCSWFECLHYNTSPTCFTIRSPGFLQTMKTIFSPRRYVIYPTSFSSKWNQQNSFCVVVLQLKPAVYFVTEYVTCDKCHKFHTGYHAMTSFECSFRGHSKRECGVSARYKHQKALLPVQKTFLNLWKDVEWQICLYRAQGGKGGHETDQLVEDFI